MHVITEANYSDATDAVRDVLLLFADLAESYAGFGHASDVYIRFDPMQYVDAVSDGKAYYVNLALLRSGAAVAVVCAVYDLWLEGQSLASNAYGKRVMAALDNGQFRAFEDIEQILRLAFERDSIELTDPWFEQAVIPIYRTYVLDYFRRLASADRYPQ